MENDHQQKIEATHEAKPRQGVLRRGLGWYWGQRDSADKGEPVRRTIVALVLLAIGVAGSEVYGYVRDKYRDPDAYLVKMKQDQDVAFKKLQDSLSSLSGSVESGGRDALAEVKSAVSEIKATNSGLLAQLALAKDENQRLAQVAGRQAGISGGYDVILSENTGVSLDASSVLGVQGISPTGARVSLSANGSDGRPAFVQSGESIAYQSAAGRQCKVTLLSIGGGGQSASFDNSCN